MKVIFLKRLAVIVFFLIVDVLLGSLWLRQQNMQTLIEIQRLLNGVHPKLSQTLLGEELTQSIPAKQPTEADLPPNAVFTLLNTEREKRKLTPLTLMPVLSEGAEKLIPMIITNNYDLAAVDSNKVLTTFLQKSKVENLTIFHDTLIGPVTMRQLELYWESDADHTKTIASPEISVVGVATGTATISGQLQGITIILYGKPQQTVQSEPTITPQQKNQVKPVVFPFISNTSILEALNQYRADHGVHQLVEQSNLCEYAQKRVNDLVAYGSLDGHEGFKKDFENADTIPDSIKNYPGGAVGENLAYQSCRNMTTGDSFVAQTATALIEWCFDSSTKGHREAQLNTRYNNVCARNKNGYFVIIFGE